MFNVEKFETLFQMTSTVECSLSGNPLFYEIFRNLFPSGSVTGAPKIRTMQIIHELERLPRGIYTGSLGYISPDREAAFNIAIRTLVIDDAEGEMGIGSGIVFDSDPQEEYEECRLKAQFLTVPQERFQIIESLFWDGEYRRLELYLTRMLSSAVFWVLSFREKRSSTR
jgi:para-aminobenzoate synthetase / 4-amino-4-deoxychorismate lyase